MDLLPPRLTPEQIQSTAWAYCGDEKPPYEPAARPGVIQILRWVAATMGWQVVVWPDGTVCSVKTSKGPTALFDSYNAARDIREEQMAKLVGGADHGDDSAR